VLREIEQLKSSLVNAHDITEYNIVAKTNQQLFETMETPNWRRFAYSKLIAECFAGSERKTNGERNGEVYDDLNDMDNEMEVNETGVAGGSQEGRDTMDIDRRVLGDEENMIQGEVVVSH